MARFVSLTQDGEPVLVNVGHVLTVEPLDVGSRITTSIVPGTFDVSESFDAVKDLLIMATEEV